MDKVLFLSDMNPKGSGYASIVTNLATGLTRLGVQTKVIGLGYDNSEHNYPFGLLSCGSFQDAHAMVHNLFHLWKPDVLVVGMDIPIHISLLEKFRDLMDDGMRYVAITPMENGPLSQKWTLGLYPAHKILFISELGKQEAIKAGLSQVDHIRIGISDAWSPMTAEEKDIARQTMGFTPEQFLVLDVADNQERKNLEASFKTIAELKKHSEVDIRYLLVTREDSPQGWDLRDMAQRLDIEDELIIFERGMSAEQLRILYNIADVFLRLSKAEGLGLPILEAMACGCPVVATDTGAITELLQDGRGGLVEAAYTIDYDVWGNSRRTFADPIHAAKLIVELYNDELELKAQLTAAREFAVSRSNEAMCEQLKGILEEVANG